MIYSVWNQAAQVFDVFEDDRPQAELNAPAPAHLRARTIGATVDQAAWPLPAGARRTGTSHVAVGRIATAAGGAGLGGVVADVVGSRLGMLALGGALAWWNLHRRRPR